MGVFQGQSAKAQCRLLAQFTRSTLASLVADIRFSGETSDARSLSADAMIGPRVKTNSTVPHLLPTFRTTCCSGVLLRFSLATVFAASLAGLAEHLRSLL
mmetsp:Transcript_114772/g.161182  ORF Transcript_114772/g.161182 Transcript_114772/m.161182 type:complete len:100 (-) Transcript_114772:1000-1299(-)